jgi:uncharacterized membrane protein
MHLVHPACVHFTVALLVLGAALELAGLVLRRDAVRRLGQTLVVLGAASLLATLLALVVYNALLGGRLVYVHGLGVAAPAAAPRPPLDQVWPEATPDAR